MAQAQAQAALLGLETPPLLLSPDACPPRRHALGCTAAIRLDKEPDWLPSRQQRRARRGSSRRAGQDFERAVASRLISESIRLGYDLVLSPWYMYRMPGVTRALFCQPDALLFDSIKNRTIIVETKLSHTTAAWWQLETLYRPVIAAAQENGFHSQILTLELCRSLDGSVGQIDGVRTNVVKELDELQPGAFNVLCLPSRKRDSP